MSVTVRDSTDNDVPHIQAIYAHYVLHGLASFEEVPPSVDEMRARRAGVLEKRFPYIVAEAEGGVLGYAYVSLYRPRSAYRFTVENSVYVRHDTVARGVGRTLLAELIARCERLEQQDEGLDLHAELASFDTELAALRAALKRMQP